METKAKLYLTANDIAEMLGISKGKAYEIIRDYNTELKSKGYLIIQGKLPKAYFETKYFGGVATTR